MSQIKRSYLLMTLCWGLVPSAVHGTTIDMRPLATIILNDGIHCIVHDSSNSLTLYRIADAAVVHRYSVQARISRFAISPNGQNLLIACSDGSLMLWNVEAGQKSWTKTPGETGLQHAQDACFSGNGERFAICDQRDSAVIFDTRTGGRAGAVSFTPGQTNVMSVALNVDGTCGFLVDLGERLHRFDLASGQLVNTGFTAAWPVRYSTDGIYIAFRNCNSGTAERLSVVRVGTELSKQDLGEFSHIGHILPQRNGTFLVSGRRGRINDSDMQFVGTQIWPDSGRVQDVWKLRHDAGVNERTSFSPSSMIGISTDFNLRTHINDLRTGKVEREIDNSANYRESYTSYYHRGIDPLLLWGGTAVLVTLVIGFFLWWRRRVKRRRIASKVIAM